MQMRNNTPTAEQEEEEEEREEMRLGFRIQVRDRGVMGLVEVEWRWGRDVVLFESFCGKMKGIIQQSQS